jgi:Mrp family chromosome partitioning ATPase
VRRAKQLLSDVGAKVFGVVLNNVTVSRHDYYYHRYHDYYYNREHDDFYADAEPRPNGKEQVTRLFND